MTASFVQDLGSAAPSATQASTSVTLTVASTAGNAIVVNCIQASTSGFTSVVDSKGNTYTKIKETLVGTSHIIATFIAVATTALAPGDTITLTSSVSNQYPVLTVYEFSAVDGAVAISTSATDPGTSAATYNVPGVAIPAGEHLLLGVIGASGAGRTQTPSGTWQQLTASVSSAPTFPRTILSMWDDQVGGTLGASGTLSASVRWCAHLIALTVASVPPSPLLSKWVGAVTTNSGTVAVKISGATARLKVATDAGLTTGVVLSAVIAADSNGIAKLPVGGLTANTTYYYGVEVDSSGTYETGGQFKTFPSGASSFSFAFGSCTNSTDATSFARFRARNPQLFIHLGDFAYADPLVNDQSIFRNFYDAALTSQDQAGVLGNIPTAYVWSDHDYGGNNSTGNATAKPAAQAAYREYVPHYALPDAAGIYQTFVIGRVRFILSDTRSFKSTLTDPDDASKTMLGATQKQWVKDTINASTEALIIWGTDTNWIAPVVAGSDDWGGYSTERAELGAFFAASGKNIVVIAGDMHALAADDGTNSVGGVPVLQAAPFYNTSSAVGGTYSAGSYTSAGTQQFYGMVGIVDDGTNLTLTYNGYDNFDVSQVTLSKAYVVAPVSSAWSLWDGTQETPLTLEGVWNGASVDPVTAIEVV